MPEVPGRLNHNEYIDINLPPMSNPEQTQRTDAENQELTDNDLEQVNGGGYILMGERQAEAGAEDKIDGDILGFFPHIG